MIFVFIFNKSVNYNFGKIFLGEELPFEFKEKNIFIFFMIPQIKQILSDVRSIERLTLKKIKETPPADSFKQPLLEVMKGHDCLKQNLVFFTLKNNVQHIHAIYTFTSCLKTKNYMAPFGGCSVMPHTNGILGDTTVLSPLFYLKASSESTLNTMVIGLNIKEQPAKIILENSQFNINFDDGICLNEDLSEASIEKKVFLEEIIKSAITIKIDPSLNPTNVSFGSVYNNIARGENKKGATILNEVQTVSRNYLYKTRCEAIQEAYLKGISAPTEIDLLNYVPYRRAMKNESQVNTLFIKQYEMNEAMHIEFSRRVKKYDPDVEPEKTIASQERIILKKAFSDDLD